MNKVVWVAVGSAVLATVSFVADIAMSVRYHLLVKKVGKSLEKVEDMTEEKIAESMIKSAIEKSAEKKVDDYMVNVENGVLKSANDNLRIQARNAVEKSANDIRERVSEEISSQVAALDIEQLKKRVCDQAERHVINKLDDCMDSSIKKFNDQLERDKKFLDNLTRSSLGRESYLIHI